MGGKLRVLDLFSASQAPLADSASDQAAHGRSGKGSKPSLALCSLWNATRHSSDALACGQHPELAFHRRIGTPAARLGAARRNGPSFRPDPAEQRRAHSTPPSRRGSFHRTLTGCPWRSVPSIAASNANDWRRLGTSAKSHFRIAGSGAPSVRRPASAGGGTWPCTRLSTTSRLRDLEQMANRKNHNVSWAWS